MHLHVCMYAGTHDFKKALDMNAWAYCYIHQCCKAQEFYSDEFNEAATAIIKNMDKQNINVDNAKYVYLHLVNCFQ